MVPASVELDGEQFACGDIVRIQVDRRSEILDRVGRMSARDGNSRQTKMGLAEVGECVWVVRVVLWPYLVFLYRSGIAEVIEDVARSRTCGDPADPIFLSLVLQGNRPLAADVGRFRIARGIRGRGLPVLLLGLHPMGDAEIIKHCPVRHNRQRLLVFGNGLFLVATVRPHEAAIEVGVIRGRIEFDRFVTVGRGLFVFLPCAS
jgi:hypothetical protein